MSCSYEGRGAHFNRNARRSGGDRRMKIVVGSSIGAPMPHLAIQCFENRHSECHGRDMLFGGVCECACHKAEAA